MQLTTRHAPESTAEVAKLVAAASRESRPLFTTGGETALHYGLVAREPGEQISLSGMNHLIDYPARDLTITAQAGMTVDALQTLLVAENQELPIDIAHSHAATLGGALATNISGSRRLGHGTLRDYLIGIEAVDGQGNIFHGGGRVVKNVAGYDFCRLLIGSCGTLGIITQVTFKVQPRPATVAGLILPFDNWQTARQIQQTIRSSQTTPQVFDFIDAQSFSSTGLLNNSPNPLGYAVLGLAGTSTEVAWMLTTLCQELSPLDYAHHILTTEEWPVVLRCLTALTANSSDTQLMFKWNTVPSLVVDQLTWLAEHYPAKQWLAHAGSGVIWSQHAVDPKPSLSNWLLQTGHHRATELRGNLLPWFAATAAETSSAAMWGPRGDAAQLTTAIRTQFDPRGILNRGRFW